MQGNTNIESPYAPYQSHLFATKSLDLYKLQRKWRRYRAYRPGNRNKFVSAQVYFNLIRYADDEAEALCDMLAADKKRLEADGIMRRTKRVIRQRRAKADHRTANILRNHPVARHWVPSATFVLGAMILYGWQTGLCSAKYKNIGRAAGLSRQQTQTWINRFQEHSIITHVGWDWRGSHNGRNHWCKVFAVPGALRMPLVSLAPAMVRLRDSVKSSPNPPAQDVPAPRKSRGPPRKKKPGPLSKLLWDFPEPGEWHFQQVQKRAEKEHYDSIVAQRRLI